MPRRDPRPLRAAFDEAEFGSARTLNLRATLPTAAEAVTRTESWLRQRQMERAGRVLIITGRGNNSPDGVSPVREAVMQSLHSLRRRGVVADWQEHTPGSVVVELAAVSALFETPARRREPHHVESHDPAELLALAPDIRASLRRLAILSLESLGARDIARYVETEMVRQFARLSAGLPQGEDRERVLRDAIDHALDELGA